MLVDKTTLPMSLGISSDPPTPLSNACFTVHIDRTGIAVRLGEGKNPTTPVGFISVDDLRACPLP